MLKRSKRWVQDITSYVRDEDLQTPHIFTLHNCTHSWGANGRHVCCASAPTEISLTCESKKNKVSSKIKEMECE